MRKIYYLLVFFVFSSLQAQQPKKLNAAEIYKEIQQLNFLGSVLYIAAHPDDENTRLLSYLTNETHARTAYLSITRGDGGQNLIGPELGPLLGIIRTQELLSARKIDGGHQFFTRANDFGYSKHPEETMNIWNKSEVLSDVVRIIRKFQPDIIINRFDHTTPGETHGHHTASAMLSVEAFNLAGKKTAFPDQLENLPTWKPKKLYQNTSPWFYDSQEAFDEDKGKFLEIETGVYFPLLGLSNNEIAALSRSEHQSQGFGSAGSRGASSDYLKNLGNKTLTGNTGLFDGIDTSWSRLKGGSKIGDILLDVEEEFNFKNPSASIPKLLEAYTLIQNLEDEHWKKIKSEDIKEIIAASAGLYLEVVADNPTATRGGNIKLKLEAINRNNVPTRMVSVEMIPGNAMNTVDTVLLNNQPWRKEISLQIPKNSGYTTPYWLRNSGTLGMYTVDNSALIGLPETPRVYKVKFHLNINGTNLNYERPVVYKTTDPVKGEVYRPFEIVPELSISIEDKVIIFPDEEPQRIPVVLKSEKDMLKGTLKLKTPENWSSIPNSFDFEFHNKAEEKTFYFTVTPPPNQSEGSIEPIAEINGRSFTKEIQNITYDHIPTQMVVLPAAAKVVKLDINKRGNLIGYIHGAGDEVPRSLEQIGYSVINLKPENISSGLLKKYDAIVVGIRAYNTIEALRTKQDQLLEYVHNGGNLIVQYNTSQRLELSNLAPYPLSLSRGRVTDENAPVTFLAPEHPVLNVPNQITQKDFEGWVQERGLYFPGTWAPEFTPILSMNDPSEAPLAGSLLVAPYGKGHYIYTGISFFRELPAGVPGAFRLFANLVSLGPNMQPQEEN